MLSLATSTPALRTDPPPAVARGAWLSLGLAWLFWEPWPEVDEQRHWACFLSLPTPDPPPSVLAFLILFFLPKKQSWYQVFRGRKSLPHPRPGRKGRGWLLAAAGTAEGAAAEHRREVSSEFPGPLVPFSALVGPHALLHSRSPGCFLTLPGFPGCPLLRWGSLLGALCPRVTRDGSIASCPFSLPIKVRSDKYVTYILW